MTCLSQALVGFYYFGEINPFFAEQPLGLSIKSCSVLHKVLLPSPGGINNMYLVYISEKAMATHSSTLAWRIPWTEEPGRLQSMGSLRVGHD